MSDWYENARHEPSSVLLRSPLRVSAYAELEDGRDVEVIGECSLEWINGRTYPEDIQILAVRVDPTEEPIDLDDLSEQDHDILIDALESAAVEVEL